MTDPIIKHGLSYDTETGVFVWIDDPCVKPQLVGKRAGSAHHEGYRLVGLFGKRIQEHRLAWLFFYGAEPPGELDHINMDRSDNRIANLRLATRSENMRNRGAQGNNKTGFKGVHWHAASKRFRAQIQINGERRCLGLFTTAEEAAAAFRRAETDSIGGLDKART